MPTSLLHSLVAALLVVGAPGYAAAPQTTLDLLERAAPATVHGARHLLLDVTPGGPGLVAVGEMGLLLGSSDDGQSWRQLNGPSAVMLTAVHFPDAQHGWAVGHDGVILATSDGGRSWHRQFDGRNANEAMLRAAQEELTAVQSLPAKNADRLAQAEDQLAAAQDAIKAGPSRPFLSVRFVNATHGFAAGAYGQLFATDNGGADWRYIGNRLPNPEGLHLNGLSLSDQGATIYIAAEQGVVFASTDGGTTWRRGETGYAGQLYGVLALPGAAGSEGREPLLAYGFNGHLFRSSDRGASWSALPGVPSGKTWVQARLYQGTLLLLSEDGRLFSSRDAGDTLRPVGDSPLATRRFAGFTLAHGHLVTVGQGGVGLHSLELKNRQP
jgi:photosystem II stability/assembly factor-like uncharacterized protein